MTDNLFSETKELCPICSANMCLLNNLLVCPDCGDYLIFGKKREIKESCRTIEKSF